MHTTTTKRFLTRATLALAVLLPAFVLIVAICATVPPANAATMNHGDFMGPTVAYLDVTETSVDPLPLYGAPITIGDTLAFFEPSSSNPSLGFSAESTNGIGDITDGFISLAIVAKPGNGISDLTFSEGGDYTMSGLPGAVAQVKAVLKVFELSIMDVDGVPLNMPIVLSAVEEATFDLPGDPASGLWNLSSTFDLDAALTGAGQSFFLGATRIVAKVNNTLTALSQPDSVANIVKKNFDIIPETRVPEPTTLALAAIGLVGMLVKRRLS